MKKKLMILGAFMMLATMGFSQFEVKINPISALFGSIPISAEYIVSDNIGAEVAIGYRFGDNTSGLNSKVLFKYYFSPDKGGDKFYTAPYFNYTNYGGSTVDIFGTGSYSYKYTAIGVGLALGYKWVADGGFLADIGFGAGKNFAGGFEYDDPTYTFDTDVFPLNFLTRISIGYRF
ncbi:MAG: DUF3575 domain-containing protein [Bacteroidales bacterium]|nr:DUF3575 domain-containing protein [Bacteroidales bacterium]